MVTLPDAEALFWWQIELIPWLHFKGFVPDIKIIDKVRTNIVGWMAILLQLSVDFVIDELRSLAQVLA